ncbi:MAG: YciI family protein [Rothia sp. (in: high G+C Gram-positive bacteria)]|nr:YciI family protein [Rothia sp. (in: high G+C Gram-positive bacteria)]
MTTYAVQYSYGPADLQAEHRPAHRAYLAQLHEEGKLHAAGAYQDGEPAGALLIFEADSEEQLKELIAADPMSTGKVLTGYSYRLWSAVIGSVGK